MDALSPSHARMWVCASSSLLCLQMMQNLLLQVGDMVVIKSAALPKGKFVKLQPVTSDFLDITNPKAVLERTLRSYSCLTVGDCIVVNYNNKNYEIEVREAKPQDAISIIETDCQVRGGREVAPGGRTHPTSIPPPSNASLPLTPSGDCALPAVRWRHRACVGQGHACVPSCCRRRVPGRPAAERPPHMQALRTRRWTLRRQRTTRSQNGCCPSQQQRRRQ